jgi:hypothetical protein
MSNLNEQQFAQYSSIQVPHKIHTYEFKPLPASMERHAPGEYQPTLPGMENMLKGEHTHTDVLFNHPNQAEKWTANDGKVWDGDVPGSNWYHKTTLYHGEDTNVQIRSLRPVQDWVDDNYLNSPDRKRDDQRRDADGTRPLVERIGRKNVLQDGHHRVARARLAGDKTIDVTRWG